MENIGENSRQRVPMDSDDDLMRLLQELHIPTYDSEHIPTDDFDLMLLVDNLINRATDTIDERTKDVPLENGIQKDLVNKVEWKIIGSISCQVIGEILNGKDAHIITIGVLKYLRNLSWKQKVLVTLIAFGVTFGDFWLLVRKNATNAVNKPMTSDQTEPTFANKDAYKYQIKSNNDFIKSLLETTKILFNIKFFYNHYTREFFGAEDGPLGNSGQFPVYVYWIMRCAIVAATQIIILSRRGFYRYLVGIPDPREVDKLNSLKKYTMSKLYEFKERSTKWSKIPYLWSCGSIDRMMMSIVTTEEHVPPLYHSVTKRKDHFDVLLGKRVLLLISGPNITSEDITNLKHVIIDSEKDVILWIPVLKRPLSMSDDVENQLEKLRNSMPWYSIHQPSMITEAGIEAIIIELGFNDRPILVILSPSLDKRNENAIHMVNIWQNLPVDNLTNEMEIQLWEKETWNLKFLVNDIDHIIQEWIRDQRYILMYGGNDIEWIHNVIGQAHSIACNLLVDIKMVYMGNSHTKDHGRNLEDVMITEQVSHWLPKSSRAYFWSRVNSMIESKEKIGKMNDPNDKLLHEILRFKSHEEWVLLAKGSTILGHVSGQIALAVLEEVQKCKTTVVQIISSL